MAINTADLLCGKCFAVALHVQSLLSPYLCKVSITPIFPMRKPTFLEVQ